MAKLKRITTEDGSSAQGWVHWCPACKSKHAFAVEKPFPNGARWTFDGNMDTPTFVPSMNIRIGPYPARDEPSDPPAGHIDVCHYFLRDGVLQFLPDCTHTMAGQNVPLPDLP